jgi:hypothetical protein
MFRFQQGRQMMLIFTDENTELALNLAAPCML